MFAAACSSESTGGTAASANNAERSDAAKLCVELAPKVGEAGQIYWWSDATAGAVTRIARLALGHTVEPWDELPGDHRVVVCTYGLHLSAESSTTICPLADAHSFSPDKRRL